MSHAPLAVLCLSNMYPGSADPDYGVFVADMCRELSAQGNSVETAVIASRRAGRLRTPAKYARLGARVGVRARGADVIYGHYLFPTGALAAGAGHAHGVPWVLTAHGGDVRNLERRWIRRAARPGIEGAAALIVVSEYLRRGLDSHGFALPPVHVVNMGVSLERFTVRDRAGARTRLRIDGDGPIILAVGGLTERKNPLTLIEAFGEIQAAEPAARLALVGDGPLAGPVDDLAARLGVATSVIRPGAVAHDRVADWMAAADVLAMVSTVEPLGQVALEALACGRPVVATRQGGAVEIVPPSGPGRHVDPADASAIADAIGEILAMAPGPDVCRAAAEPHALETQAGRVAEILGDAAHR